MSAKDENARKRNEAEIRLWLEELAALSSTREEIDSVINTIVTRTKTIAAYGHNVRAFNVTKSAHQFLRQLLPSLRKLVPVIDQYSRDPRKKI